MNSHLSRPLAYGQNASSYDDTKCHLQPGLALPSLFILPSLCFNQTQWFTFLWIFLSKSPLSDIFLPVPQCLFSLHISHCLEHLYVYLPEQWTHGVAVFLSMSLPIVFCLFFPIDFF